MGEALKLAGWMGNNRKHEAVIVEHYFAEGEEKSLCGQSKRAADNVPAGEASQGKACAKCEKALGVHDLCKRGKCRGYRRRHG